MPALSETVGLELTGLPVYTTFKKGDGRSWFLGPAPRERYYLRDGEEPPIAIYVHDGRWDEFVAEIEDLNLDEHRGDDRA